MSEWTKDGMQEAIRENPDNPNLDAFLDSVQGKKFGLRKWWKAEQGKTVKIDKDLQADAPPGVTVVAAETEEDEPVEDDPAGKAASTAVFDEDDTAGKEADAKELAELQAGYAKRDQELDAPANTAPTYFPDGYEPSMAAFVGDNKPYLHNEPSEDQVDDYYLRMLGAGPEMNQIRRQLKAKGEESEAYSRAADNLWDRVREVHEQKNLPAVRVEKWDGDGLTPALLRLLEGWNREAKAVVGGFSKVGTLGMAMPTLSMIEGARNTDSAATTVLRDEGTIQGFVEENEAQASREPGWGVLGSAFGLGTPLVKSLYGMAGPALAKNAGATGGMVGLEEMVTGGINQARHQLGAGPVETGWPMVNAPEFPPSFETDPAQTGPAIPQSEIPPEALRSAVHPPMLDGPQNYQAGQAPLPSMGDTVKSALGSGATAAAGHMALGGMLKGAGALGRANSTSLRNTDRTLGPHISNMERDPAIGEGGAFGMTGGLKVPGGVQRAQAGRAAGTTGLGKNATSAQIISGGKNSAVDKILRSLGKRADVAEARWAAETNQVLDASGSKPVVNMAPLSATLRDLIAKSTRRVRTMTRTSKRETTGPVVNGKGRQIETATVTTKEQPEAAAERKLLKELRQMEKDLQQQTDVLRPDGTKSPADLPRKMTLRRFDELTQRIDAKAKYESGSAKAATPSAESYKHLSKALRDIRNTDGVPKEYVALKARHWNEIRAEQNVRTQFGLKQKPTASPDGTYDARDTDSVRGVLSRGTSGTEKIIENYRKTDRGVDVAIAEHDAAAAYQRMLNRGGDPATQVAGMKMQHASALGSAFNRGRHAYDGTYHQFKRLEDKTGMVSTGTQFLSRQVPTATGRKVDAAAGTPADSVMRWVSRTYDQSVNELSRAWQRTFGDDEGED